MRIIKPLFLILFVNLLVVSSGTALGAERISNNSIIKDKLYKNSFLSINDTRSYLFDLEDKYNVEVVLTDPNDIKNSNKQIEVYNYKLSLKDVTGKEILSIDKNQNKKTIKKELYPGKYSITVSSIEGLSDKYGYSLSFKYSKASYITSKSLKLIDKSLSWVINEDNSITGHMKGYDGYNEFPKYVRRIDYWVPNDAKRFATELIDSDQATKTILNFARDTAIQKGGKYIAEKFAWKFIPYIGWAALGVDIITALEDDKFKREFKSAYLNKKTKGAVKFCSYVEATSLGEKYTFTVEPWDSSIPVSEKQLGKAVFGDITELSN